MSWNRFKNFFNIERRTKYFIHVVVFLCIAAISIFGLLIVNSEILDERIEKSEIIFTNTFDEIALEAKSAVVWDVINGRELFVKNPDFPLPLASLTKVMAAVVADSVLPSNTKVRIMRKYLKPEGDSGLLVGDLWSASDLRDFTLLTSSNDGAFALAALTESTTNTNINEKNNENLRAQFIKAMNDKALDIGLLNSRFFNEHGLDKNADRGGAYGSARDMALLFQYILQNNSQILEATRHKDLTFASAAKVYSANNTNIFVNQIPGLIASKTGYTDLAGGNLVIAYDAGLNRPIIISILGSTIEGRFSDTLKLVEASMKYIQDN